MTVEACIRCNEWRSDLRHVAKAAAKAERSGQPVDLSAVSKLKANIRECAGSGHTHVNAVRGGNVYAAIHRQATATHP